MRPRGSRPWSLAARLTAWYAASAFLLIFCATAFLYGVLFRNLDREDDQFLADKVRVLRQQLRERPAETQALWREAEGERATRQDGQIYVRLLDENGSPVMETAGMGVELATTVFPDAGPVGAEPGPSTEVHTPAGKTFLVVAVRAALGRSGGRSRVIQLAFDRTYEEALLSGYRRNLLLVLGVALVACALVGYRIARRGLRPVAAIAATACRIRATTLHERIDAGRYPAELSALAGTFNEMLDRLQQSFSRLGRFSADIAHELRTPVNNLRGEAEVALGKPRSPEEYRDVLGSCLEECGRLSHMIDSLLFLARAEHPETQAAKEPLDVGRELSAIREFYEAAAGERGITLRVGSGEGVVGHLDRTLFQRAVGNLVANALAHTGPGGVVTLSAARDGPAVRVEVADTGCGIPACHLPHVFDRFYRVDESRSNASGRVGLGLAIVKSIAGLHGGSVSAASEVGKGSRFRICLPCGLAGDSPAAGPDGQV